MTSSTVEEWNVYVQYFDISKEQWFMVKTINSSTVYHFAWSLSFDDIQFMIYLQFQNCMYGRFTLQAICNQNVECDCVYADVIAIN